MKTILIAVSLLVAVPAFAKDYGQWENTDPIVKKWYQGLMQPDSFPPISCCGAGDAYWADEYYVEGEKLIAVITDDRDDLPLMRSHVEIGTKYVVPNAKLLGAKQEGNPTGHSVIFLGTIEWPNNQVTTPTRHVLCFALGTGG